MKRKRRTNRGRGRRRNKATKSTIKVLGTNADGLYTKKDSLYNLLHNEKPSIFTIQETKLKRKMQINSPSYEIFESLRENRSGGGLMIGIDKNLSLKKPVIIFQGEKDVEILVVEIILSTMSLRIMTAYGPQEDSSPDTINEFYRKFEEEIIKCEEDNCGLVIEMDANAKLGRDIIEKDPNPMSENGRILWGIVQRRNCYVVNATDKCNGTITRSRTRKGVKEESILDYMIVNQKIEPYIHSMNIDENKEMVLTRFLKKNIVVSDHNILTCSLNIPHHGPPKPRIELLSLRNPEDLQKFKEVTTSTNKFTKCFEMEGSVKQQGKIWLKTLMTTIHRTFRKVRITDKTMKRSKTQILIDKRKEIRKKLENTHTVQERHLLEDQLQAIEDDIADECSAQHINLIKQHSKELSDGEGNMVTGKVWKLRKKLCPKPKEHLTVKKDKEGKRVSDPDEIQKIYMEAYHDRLTHRNINPDLEKLKQLRERLFKQRIEECKNKKSPDWNMEDLDKVLSRLKSGKAADPLGLVNELFMLQNIGQDLKNSILLMMNKIKNQFETPEFMELANITSFWKGKGPKDDIEMERGVFILVILRMIKDRLVYNDITGVVEMSDSQVGARTEYNIRNHLFVLYSVANSVINKESDAIDIHMYDLYKCFDSLWLEECCNNLYEAGVCDDKLALIYEGNMINRVAVKTPAGLTERMEINRIVTQGGVTGPLCCAVHTDCIGKESLMKHEHVYLYKNRVQIPALAMIDDIAQISVCGVESVKDNAYINAKFEQDKLLMNGPKCHKLHMGKASKFCPILKAHNEDISSVSNEKYVGDIVSNNGRHTANIKARRSKGIGVVNEILSILNHMGLGSHYFKAGMLLRTAMLHQVLLCNAEAWLRLGANEIRMLERVDELLLRSLLKVPKSTPGAALYLETGSIPIHILLKVRRIMCLHHILT